MDGLLTPPERKQVRFKQDETDKSYFAECYTVPMAASALDRCALTFKRWLKEDMVPPPILEEVSTGYDQYEVGELDIIRQHLVEHEQEYSYLLYSHVDRIKKIHNDISHYRAFELSVGD